MRKRTFVSSGENNNDGADGTRTRDPLIQSPTRYPLRHGDWPPARFLNRYIMSRSLIHPTTWYKSLAPSWGAKILRKS